MLSSWIQNTPLWVFALFLGLLWLGLQQTRARTLKPARVLWPALGLTLFSWVGVLRTWPDLPAALLSWLGAVTTVGLALAFQPAPPGLQFDPDQRRFTVPGSAVPLLALMGLFLTQYALGSAKALHANWLQAPHWAALCAAVWGSFSGVFLGRAGRLWRLARQTQRAARQWAMSTAQAHEH